MYTRNLFNCKCVQDYIRRKKYRTDPSYFHIVESPRVSLNDTLKPVKNFVRRCYFDKNKFPDEGLIFYSKSSFISQLLFFFLDGSITLFLFLSL